MRIILLGIVLALSGCGAADPYAAPLPAENDQKAIDATIQTVAPQDRPLLAGYYARHRQAAKGLIPAQVPAQTVGGAINDQRRTNEDAAEARARKQAAAELLDQKLDGGADAVERMLSNLTR